MKKSVFFRTALIMLVLTMVTSCFVGGTFAKYVTSDSINDSARVANWGVVITAEGSLFAESYKNTPVTSAEDVDQTITVQVLDYAQVEQNLVAPGTKNETGMTFEISGQPEVDVDLQINVEGTDIVLPAGTYDDPTTGDSGADDTFTLAEDYHPVKFTLTNDKGVKVVDGKTLAELEEYLEALDTDEIIETNTDLATLGGGDDGVYTLTWAWDFDDNGAGTNDQADTLLGNIAAGLDTVADSSTSISFEITITATQVD